MVDRGVSELLGFVLVFSLIVSSVAVVYVGGFQSVTDARDAERVNNAELAFDVLADNLNAIDRRAAPARATELKLAEAQLRLVNGPEVNVTITSGAASTPTYKRDVDPIVYTDNSSETELVYENGAVVRTDGDGGVMRRRPPMVFHEDGTTRVAVVPIIQTRSAAPQQAGGDRAVRVRASEASTVVLNTEHISGSTPYGLRVTVQTTTERAPVWERFLDDEVGAAYGIDDPCRVDEPSTVVCEFEVDRLYVTATYVDVSFSG